MKLDHDQLDLAMDVGTSKTAMAWTRIHNGVRSQVKPLMIDERSFEVPTMATWHDGVFMHGLALQRESARNRNIKIIDNWKLALYQGPGTSATIRRVEATLAEMPGEKTLDMLITEYLKVTIEDAKAALRKSSLKIDFRTNMGQLDDLLENMHVRISVPQMWTPDAIRRMQTAARNAGIHTSNLAYEPQCALAYLVSVAASQKADIGQLDKGDSILVIDIGRGTGDFVLYELKDKLTVNSRLSCVGQSSGEICGGFQVDEELLRTLKKRQGLDWYEKARAALGLDPQRFERQVLIALEEAKLRFGKDDEDITTTNIKGVGGEYQTFQLQRTDFHDAFDLVITKIMAEINKHTWGIMPTVFLVTGGFSKSRYLMEKLRSHYEPMGTIVVRPSETDVSDCFPVAVGALQRYDRITRRPLRSQYNYMVLQRQDFHKAIHTDAYVEFTDWDDSTHTELKSYVKDNPYGTDNDIVDDRVHIIIKKGQKLRPDESVTTRHMQEYIVPCDRPCLTDEFVYSTVELCDNEWAMAETDIEGEYELRPGVFRWASVDIPLDKSLLEGRGFKEVVSNGEGFWELEVRIILRNSDMGVKIGYEILKPPPSEAYDWNSGAEPGLPKDVAFRVKETLFDANHPDFIE